MRGKLAVALTTLAAVTACGRNSAEEAGTQPAPVACTMIGCSDGVRVLIEGNVPERFTVHVSESGRLLRSYECLAERPCDVFVENEKPTEVQVRITWGADRDREWTVNPTYRDAQPNGPACPPTCRQGTVAITV